MLRVLLFLNKLKSFSSLLESPWSWLIKTLSLGLADLAGRSGFVVEF